MSYSDQYEGGRNSAVAVKIGKTADGGKEQYVDVEGMSGEKFTKVQRMQPFGLSAHAPAGSIGIGVCPGGRRDLMVVMAGEHPDKRPTDTAEGDAKLYNEAGANLHLEGKTATLSGIDKFVIEAGGTTVTIDASGVKITGGKVTHEGKNIGSTHKHGGVFAGSADTDVPSN